MKKLFLTITGCILSILLFAQTPVKTITVSGLVLDSATTKPISFVTVALSDALTKKLVKSSVTNDNGTFEIKGLAVKPYLLTFIYVGYKTQAMAVPGDVDFKSGSVMLSPANSLLKEVSVSALKPLMKQEVDRVSYDIQADPESKIMSALDMMRKVPLLSVDGNDNIQLRSSGNFKILLNGKESALFARNPSDILKSMPGTNIIKIEVITTPPAKYDAEGLAGIINIITKKNVAQGYSGSVNTNYNTVQGYRLNLNTTVKQGKFGITGFIGTSKKPDLSAPFQNQTTFFAVPSTVLQYGDKSSGLRNTFANAELSYEIDSLNLLTGTLNIFNNRLLQGNDQFTNLYNGNNALTQAYRATNTGSGNGQGTDVGFNYQLGFKGNKGQLLTASYKYSIANNNLFNDIVTTQLREPNYHQYNDAGSKEYTTQLDYIQPVKLLTLEAGAKMILRNNSSNFSSDTLSSTGYHTDPKQTNNFTYHQHVYSLYNSYTMKFTKWVFKGGLRLERTSINADFANSGSSTFDQQFSNLVPSLSVQRVLQSNTSLTFGFTQRIQRPGIMQLNPFADRSNPLYINMGNPALRPAVNNNFELSYGNFRKGSVNISASYSFANNTIQQISIVNGNVTTQTFANLGKTKQLGIDVFFNYSLTKKFNVNINAELLQIWLQGYYNQALLINNGQQGHIFTNYAYKFGKGYRLGLNIGYDSRYVFLQGRDNWFFAHSANISKELFKGKGGISAGIANPYDKFNKLDFFYKTADFASVSNYLNYYRAFTLNFNYKFGKLNSEIKKNQRGINNDDTSGGRD